MRLTPLIFKKSQLKKIRQLLFFFVKYARSEISDYILRSDVIDIEAHESTEEAYKTAESFSRDLESMGPTFIKLGQFFSTRSDFLPEIYLKELERLQDEITPMPFEEVLAIIKDELGDNYKKTFSSIDPKPLGSASIGQVHLAKLLDGRQLAIKIQRPNVDATVSEDFELLESLVNFLHERFDWARANQLPTLLAEFKNVLVAELDYRKELQNLQRARKNLASFKQIVIPGVYEAYSSKKVLSMDYIEGSKITDLGHEENDKAKLKSACPVFFKAFLKQILKDGFYHSDPHPGNILLDKEGRVVLLDYGMVGHLSRDLQFRMLLFFQDVSEGDTRMAVRHAMEIGEYGHEFDKMAFSHGINRMMSQLRREKAGDISMGHLILGLVDLSRQCGLRLPEELGILGKTFLNLDKALMCLDPEFSPTQAFQDSSEKIFRWHLKQQFSMKKAFSGAMDYKELFQNGPSKFNRFLELASENKLFIRSRVMDEDFIVSSFNKIANRLVLSIVLAAIIIGASLTMNIDTQFKAFGYPILGIAFFLIATLGGGFLILQIFIQDHWQKRRKK